MQPANITTIWKKKSSKNYLVNYRGIFNVSKLRTIMDKMVLEEVYETVDSNMGPSNIGARKGKNVRDHLLVMNSVINEAIHDKDTGVDITVYDVVTCFDKMDYKSTANDMFDVGVKGDNFVILALANEKSDVAVKTPWGGSTERKTVTNIEQQGTVSAPLKCAVQIGSIGEICLEAGYGYRFRNSFSLPPLSYIDDVLSITKCGINSTLMNAVIQDKISSRHLKLGSDKCFKMHVGIVNISCPKTKTNDNYIKEVNEITYLGTISHQMASLTLMLTSDTIKG